MTLDLGTAKRHGVCPVCGGYGGRPDDDECQAEDSTCPGSCPRCWCPGCHDGAGVAYDSRTEDHPIGSWVAYAHYAADERQDG